MKGLALAVRCLGLEVRHIPSAHHLLARAGYTAPPATECGKMSNIKDKHTCVKTGWMNKSNGSWQFNAIYHGRNNSPRVTSISLRSVSPAHTHVFQRLKAISSCMKRGCELFHLLPKFPPQTSSESSNSEYTWLCHCHLHVGKCTAQLL